jgi:predicted acetyltransferase
LFLAVETPVQYLDAPELQRFWTADAKKHWTIENGELVVKGGFIPTLARPLS